MKIAISTIIKKSLLPILGSILGVGILFLLKAISGYVKSRYSIDIALLFNDVSSLIVACFIFAIVYILITKPKDYEIMLILFSVVLIFLFGLIFQDREKDEYRKNKNQYLECIEKNKNRKIEEIQTLCRPLL